MNEAKKLDLHERIEFGVRRGVERALAAHKKAGRSIVVWRDGKIVRIPPEEIVVDEELLK
jgi:hypothetical protein